VTPRRWVDAEGRPLRTRPCLKCGTPTPMFRLTVEEVRRNGGSPLSADSTGPLMWSRPRVLPIRGKDGRCDLVPVIGEAR